MLHVVITTIQPPTPCMIRLAKSISGGAARMVVAGDAKGPSEYDLSGIDGLSPDQIVFLGIEAQSDAESHLGSLLPRNHYCRKNMGYLHAIRTGASCVYETDDDNAPLDSWGQRDQWVNAPRFAKTVFSEDPSWVNVYKFFTDDLIWPRGLPLDRIRERSTLTPSPAQSLANSPDKTGKYWAPIQQGLANGAPDVDAAWRLILDREFDFDQCDSVMLAPGQWCPFNTQTTWWWPAVYPLLYVPSYCSFRMCDIWKSFVAQRCLWEMGTGVVFHAPEVVQERNPHQLMRDFEDEIAGYLQNHRLAEILESVGLQSDVACVGANLRACYAELVAKGIFPEKELPLVDAWIADIDTSITQAPSNVSTGD